MSATQTQVGGTHYKDMPIQPIEFITKNKLGYIEGCVIKYICRHRAKNGREDLEKAKHYIEMLMEVEYMDDSTSNRQCYWLRVGDQIEEGDQYRHINSSAWLPVVPGQVGVVMIAVMVGFFRRPIRKATP